VKIFYSHAVDLLPSLRKDTEAQMRQLHVMLGELAGSATFTDMTKARKDLHDVSRAVTECLS